MNTSDIINPNQIVDNKLVLLEQMSLNKIDKDNIKDTLLEEFKSEDKDVRLLTYRVILEKFNNIYAKEIGNNKITKELVRDALHKAIVTSKKEQIMGDGIVSLNNPMATVNLINESETVSEVMKKCVLDYMLFGGFALNVIKTKDNKINLF